MGLEGQGDTHGGFLASHRPYGEFVAAACVDRKRLGDIAVGRIVDIGNIAIRFFECVLREGHGTGLLLRFEEFEDLQIALLSMDLMM